MKGFLVMFRVNETQSSTQETFHMVYNNFILKSSSITSFVKDSGLNLSKLSTVLLQL